MKDDRTAAPSRRRLDPLKAQLANLQGIDAKASITRTGLLSSTQSSRLSGNSVDCARSAPATKRFINSPAESSGESWQRPRFHTARVTLGNALTIRSIPAYPAATDGWPD